MKVCDNCRKRLADSRGGRFELKQTHPAFPIEDVMNPRYMRIFGWQGLYGELCSLQCVVEFASARFLEE